MSEEYPLLYEDLSEEDKSGQNFHRRSRRISLRGRARNQVKGAAAIIRHWPEHWSTILAYWWIIFGMIALTSFIVYNCLFSFATLHPSYPKPVKPLENVIKHYKNTDFFTTTADVYMHVFVKDREEIDLDKYLPYIEIITNEYKNFKYHFVIVSNDTVDSSNLSDELNNELAFNSLWSKKESFNNVVPKNIAVEHVVLSRYLNNSPLQKHWNSLPKQFIQFLVRAISVWEKGGIAVNPVIFTPQSPNSIYIDKVKKILQNFKKSNVKSKKTMKNFEKANIEKGGKEKGRKNPKANNIRDIINALESNENASTYSYHDILDVAESKIDDNISKNNSRVQFIKDSVNKNPDHLDDKGVEHKVQHKEIIIKDENGLQQIEDDSKRLPLFLNYFYHNDTKSLSTETNTAHRIRKSPVTKEITKERLVKDLKVFEDIKPMIVSAKGLIDNNDSVNEILPTVNDSNEDLFELTVDLKGNVIATETPCHAFVGDIFTNAVHYDDSETLTDFIIKELSIFCKGLLTSCVGIDVILI